MVPAHVVCYILLEPASAAPHARLPSPPLVYPPTTVRMLYTCHPHRMIISVSHELSPPTPLADPPTTARTLCTWNSSLSSSALHSYAVYMKFFIELICSALLSPASSIIFLVACSAILSSTRLSSIVISLCFVNSSSASLHGWTSKLKPCLNLKPCKP